MACLVRGEMLQDKHILDTLVPWSPGTLWSLGHLRQLSGHSLPAIGHCCLGQASLGRLRAVLPLVMSSSFTGGIFSKLPLPCSEQTLDFVPCQRTGLCPNLRRVLLRTLFRQAERLCLIGEFWVVDVLREPLHEVPVSWARTEARGASHH